MKAGQLSFSNTHHSGLMPGVSPTAQPSGDDITIATVVENDPVAPFNCDYSIESIERFRYGQGGPASAGR